MSRDHLSHLLHRARTYAGYRRMLHHDPELALLDYDLAVVEREALLGRDSRALAALGVESDLAHWWCAPAATPVGDG